MGKIGKLFTTILVLGAIAGIGVGGYYGYQYLKNRKSNDTVAKQNGSGQGNQSNNQNGKIDEKDPKNSGNKNSQNSGSSSENNTNNNPNADDNGNENTDNGPSSKDDSGNTQKPKKPALEITDAIERMFYKPKNLIRVGHWNILNYGGGESSDKNGPKVRAISELIYKSKLDVVGLTEINYKKGETVKNIVDALNKISSDRDYKFLVQSDKDANPKSSNATREQIAIIYNSKKIREKNFSTGKSIESYGTTQTFKNTSYKRPLFAAYFETIEGNKPFVSIFAHLDSPAYKEENGEKADKTYLGQGAQEVAEALEIPNAFKYYEQLSNNASIIFGGDTNIATENNHLFSSQDFTSNNIQNYYGQMSIHKNKEAIDDQVYEFYETSLNGLPRKSKNKPAKPERPGYANAYDKLLFKENNGLNIINEYEKTNYKDERYRQVSFKADIVNGFKNGIWNRDIILNLKPNLQLNKQGKKTSDFAFIRSKISDHTLVYIDFEIRK
ncbi:hypothetical protein HGG64_03115 [Mycoplasma phocoeninasale]|uniref:Membrane nuclease MnuA n=1 Tax=Mycoplasma phocoeninasale TaxID=2726117 RepID=A0A858U7F9_9MOLU|nr:hypothetical protein [Mycoplasma phocoeninasale]QJG66666.1 hypothetical protein HGG64_03115 [Mycoplasma phocoeninasale]